MHEKKKKRERMTWKHLKIKQVSFMKIFDFLDVKYYMS